MNTHQKNILSRYKKQGARIETKARIKLKKAEDFSLWYTPSVGVPASYLAKHPKQARSLSIKKNSVAIISDGSAVLGLGNIGPYGALPVMEGKALIFKERANIDAWPIVLNTQDTDEIIKTVIAIAPSFGGINLEDIAAPKCFTVEQELIKALDIPVMHDDQHGTAIIVLSGLINAAKVVKKEIKKLRIVVNGAGAAGSAIANILYAVGIRDIIIIDRKGIIDSARTNLNSFKQDLANISNPRKLSGGLTEAIKNADVFIGVSGKGLLSEKMVASMAPQSIVFALANPEPEIMPDVAKKAGAAVIATGRSDFPNQINNALVFPGVFRGALDKGIPRITQQAKIRTARALASLVSKPSASKIIPTLLDPRVVKTVAKAI